MKKIARDKAGDPTVRRLAINILNSYNTQSHNYLDEAWAIGDYVKRKVRYVRDANGIEQIHDPLTLIDQLERGIARADCDDMALLIATLLLSIGHKPKFRMARYKGYSGPYNHIYVVCYTHNGKNKPKRLVLDAIIKDQPIGFEVPQASGNEIEI
jgi:hypothetical protein